MNKNTIIAICFIVGAGLGFGGVKAYKAFTAPAEPPNEEIAQVVEPDAAAEQDPADLLAKESDEAVAEEPAVDEAAAKKEEERKKAEEERKKKEEEKKKAEEEKKKKDEANKPEPVGISADEVARRIMNKTISNGGKDFASKISLSFVGLKDDERPGNLSDIFFRLNLGTWSGVNVTKVSYDKAGKVNAITIQPIYPEE